jgi:regulator of sigma E protease
MTILGFIFGIMGLGVVILVHELGHYSAARSCGVEVETFSVGMGPKILSRKRGTTEWRVSAIPFGGYCRMKGEEAFASAIAEKAETIPREPGSFYGAKAWKRIIIAFSGPLANVLFAIVVFIVVSAVGTTSKTFGNRIVLQSSYGTGANAVSGLLPADAAGLRNGDTIVAIDARPVQDLSEIQDIIMRSPGKPLELSVLRDGTSLELPVTPALDKSTGAGRIGIMAWVDPVVESVAPNGQAARAGVQPGDRIVSLDGKPIAHAIEFEAMLVGHTSQATIGLERKGQLLELPIAVDPTTGGSLGIGFVTKDHLDRSPNAGAAISDGFAKTWQTFTDSLMSIGLLFRGVDVLKAVSGPARIIYYTGAVAESSVSQSGAKGMASFFSFLAFISVALFIMNLLPIPALDGGMILMFLAEIISRRPLKTKTVYRFQLIGWVFIVGLFVLAILSDILFFVAK